MSIEKCAHFAERKCPLPNCNAYFRSLQRGINARLRRSEVQPDGAEISDRANRAGTLALGQRREAIGVEIESEAHQECADMATGVRQVGIGVTRKDRYRRFFRNCRDGCS